MTEDNFHDNFQNESPTRERYRKTKNSLLMGKKKYEEMQKKEEEFYALFSSLFYDNRDPKNVKKIREAFYPYTLHELDELYRKMVYLSPWKTVEWTKFEELSSRATAAFMAIFLGSDAVAMLLISFFVWHLEANFIYVIYSVLVSSGIMGAMLVVKGVINHVRKKKTETE